MTSTLLVRHLSQQLYSDTWSAMQQFTKERQPEAQDELWLLEHAAVFTQGLAGKAEHILNPHNIPVVQTDRGGQVTYHGPGQLMIYALLNIRRLQIGPRQLVEKLETMVISLLDDIGIKSYANPDAHGVYVDGEKIGSIGLRISKGCCYHGVALNVTTELTPFTYINPCGFKGLKTTRISDHRPDISLATIKTKISSHFLQEFGYTDHSISTAQPKVLLS